MEAAEQKQKMLRNIAIGAAVIGGTTLAVATARYIGRNYIDDVIKAGTTIQTLSHNPDRLKEGQSFFTNYIGNDKAIYVGLFGGTPNNPKNKIQAKILSDVKVASRKSAEKVYNELKKTNSEFAGLTSKIENNRKAIARTGGKNAYDAFNYHSLGTGDNSVTTAKANKIFFDALKEKGYGAVTDVNDTKYSTLRGKNPAVMFDKDKIDMSNIKVSQLTQKEIARAKDWAYKETRKHRTLDYIAKNPALSAGYATVVSYGFGSSVASDIYDNKVARSNKKKQKEKK